MAMKQSTPTPYLQFRSDEENKALARGFVPVPATITKSRRYYNPSTHQEISVRTYQRLQKGLDVVNPQPLSDEKIQTYNAARTQSRDVRRLQKFYTTVNAGNAGQSASQALKAGGITRKQFETIREQRDKVAGYTYSEGKVTGISSSYIAEFPVPTFNTQGAAILEFHQFDRVEASRMGQYHHAIEEAIKGNLDELRNFGDPVVVDLQGNVIVLPTNYSQIDLYLRSLSTEDRDTYDSHIYTLVKGTSIAS